MYACDDIGVSVPSGLRRVTFGIGFKHSLDGVSASGGLEIVKLR